ncbi:MAG: alkaline phosphatase family protein, partial [Bradyrhizobiaceae bacterium]
IGPDFKAGYVSQIPVSNADVGMTAAHLMGLRGSQNGGLVGRVMSEALPNGVVPKAYVGTQKSKPAEGGLTTVLNFQRVGSQRYFDAAGFPGRTLGLEAETGKQKTAGK